MQSADRLIRLPGFLSPLAVRLLHLRDLARRDPERPAHKVLDAYLLAVLVALAMCVFIASLPVYIAQIQSVCHGTTCSTGQITQQIVETLRNLMLSLLDEQTTQAMKHLWRELAADFGVRQLAWCFPIRISPIKSLATMRKPN